MENPQSYGAAKLKGRVFFKPGAISGRFATKIEVRCMVIFKGHQSSCYL